MASAKKWLCQQQSGPQWGTDDVDPSSNRTINNLIDKRKEFLQTHWHWSLTKSPFWWNEGCGNMGALLNSFEGNQGPNVRKYQIGSIKKSPRLQQSKAERALKHLKETMLMQKWVGRLPVKWTQFQEVGLMRSLTRIIMSLAKLLIHSTFWQNSNHNRFLAVLMVDLWSFKRSLYGC